MGEQRLVEHRAPWHSPGRERLPNHGPSGRRNPRPPQTFQRMLLQLNVEVDLGSLQGCYPLCRALCFGGGQFLVGAFFAMPTLWVTGLKASVDVLLGSYRRMATARSM